jgi:small-conductance mechanosensitive channel
MSDLFLAWSESGLLRGISNLILIIALVIVALYLLKLSIDLIDKRYVATTKDPDRRARLQTLSRATNNTLRVVIVAIGVLIGMGTVGIDIGPALAAAGILGLAVSLGAQTLIKDMIGGVTILLEDQYHIGDIIKVDDVIGEVEGITLRRTDIRDSTGRLFMVPNGEVRVVANETRDWARAIVELNFGFDTDQEKTLAVLEGSLTRLAVDPDIKPHLLAAPEIFGWNNASDWAVVVRLSAKVVAGKQMGVTRTMRQYAFDALRGAGIPIESSASRVFLSSSGRPVQSDNS